MTDARNRRERARGALRDDVWSELQHRRVGKRIDEALSDPPHGRRRWLWGLSAVAAATACVAVWLALRSPSEPALAATGGALGSDARALGAAFVDGSLVDVDRGGRIRVLRDGDEETRVEVLSGRAEFEVRKRPGRPFVATVRGVEVRVVGTHFSAELDVSRPPGVVRVAVQRGIVEVLAPPPGRVARLEAGESLEIPLDSAKAPRALPPSSAASVAAPARSADEIVVPSAPSGSATPGQVPDASELFEAAHEARRSGNVQAAAKAYAALIKQFPNDERVGVAALELGRLRMDALHAYGPAADAFRRAIAAAPNDGIREDALARLIEALDAMGDKSACLREKARYQARYPRGVHAAAVIGRCASRK